MKIALRRPFVASLMTLGMAGCAGTGTVAQPVVYDSGTAPESFDIVVERESASRYRIGRTTYTFATLVKMVKDSDTHTVLINGPRTIGDVFCVSILGIETGASVFFRGGDGKPKAVSWSMDAGSTETLANGCR